MAFALFLVLLFFAPLAFGTTETWSTVTAELLTALAAVSYFFPLGKRKAAFYQIPALLPLVLCLGWIFLQCIPLPFSFAPGTAAAYQPVLDLLPPETWIPLTVNRQSTLLEGLRFATYGLFYVLTVQLLTSSRRLTITISSIAGLCLFIAFAAMLQRAAAPNTLFWVREMKSGVGSFGPWIYKNQYAGFMVMTCPLLLALFLIHRPIADEEASFREQILHFFSGSGANLHLFLSFGLIVVIASVLLAESRGGLLSLAFVLLLFFLLLARSQKKIQPLTLLVLLCGLLLASGWFSWSAILERFDLVFDTASGSLHDGRLRIWNDAVKIIPQHLVTGSGFGTFIDVFPLYKSFADSLVYDHAHNDFIELLTDGGLIGFLLAAWFVVAVLRSGWRQLFRRHERQAVLTALAAFSGIGGLLFFSITDFNLHNWANGLYFFFLCGLLVSAGHTREQYRHRPTLLAAAASPGKANALAFIGSAVLLLAGLRLHGGDILAARHYERAHLVSENQNIELDKKLTRMAELIEEAAKNAPFDGSYPYGLANIRQYQQQSEQARQLYSQAIVLDPLNGTYLQAAGLALAKTDPSTGSRLLETGYLRARLKEVPLRVWAGFELSQRRRVKAVQILRQELRRDPRLLQPIYPLLLEHQFSRAETIVILPQLTSAWLGYANLARSAGNEEEAGFFTEHALDYLDQEEKPQPGSFMQVYSYHQRQKQGEKAVEVLREGIRRLPDYAPFHIYLGDYYKGKGITYRAIEEYEQALLIQPSNEALQKKLKQLKKEQQQP